MTLSIATVADSISKLSVTGLTIRDINELLESVDPDMCPIVIPLPDGFVSGFELERMAMSSGSASVWNVSYTLTYRMLHSKVGMGTGLFDSYDDLVAKTAAFVDKILVSDTITGAVDLELSDISAFGPVADPAGDLFHGCDIALRVLEFEV